MKAAHQDTVRVCTEPCTEAHHRGPEIEVASYEAQDVTKREQTIVKLR